MWSKPSSITPNSPFQVGLCTREGQLNMVYLETTAHNMGYGLCPNTGVWKCSDILNSTNAYNQRTSAGSALVNDRGTLTSIYRGNNPPHVLFATTHDDATGNWIETGSQISITYGPSAAAYDGLVYVAFADASTSVVELVTWDRDTREFGKPAPFIAGANPPACTATPALTVYGSHLHLFYTDSSSGALAHWRLDDAGWVAVEDPGISTNAGVAAVQSQGLLYVLYRSPADISIMSKTYNGHRWSTAESTGSTAAIDGPAAALGHPASQLSCIYPAAGNVLMQMTKQ